MLRRVAPRISAFAAQRARGMCDMTEGITVDMVCRVFSCKVHRYQQARASRTMDAPQATLAPTHHRPTDPPTTADR